MKNWKKFPSHEFAALLLGGLLALAFAPYELFPLAIFSPAGLLALWLKISPRRAFWLGWLFGVGLFTAGVYWVFHSIHVFGGVPTFLACIITGGLIAILALFPATTGYLLNRFFPHPTTTKILCAFPALWVLSEWFRSFLFTGFPWLLLGYSQTNSSLVGFAPIFSVYGVSLAVLVTSSLFIYTILQFNQQIYRSFYLGLLGITTIWVMGGLLSLIPWTEPDGKMLSVNLVQGNIPQAIKWSPEHTQLSFDRYEELTTHLWKKDEIIIWPEAAIPMPLQNAAEFIQRMDDEAKATGTHLILGIPIQSTDNNSYYNALITLGSDKQVYLKRRLVPFGEYIPSLPFFSHLLNFMDIPMANMIPGNVIQKPLQVGDTLILPAICYEVAFPQLMQSNNKKIGFLLTVTNDAWFGDSSAQAQHLQMAQMRALELRRPVVFASNDGITAIINANGRIESTAPLREPFVLSEQIQPVMGLTPWMRNGLDPLLAILITFIFIAVRGNKKIIASSQQTPSTKTNLSPPALIEQKQKS